MNWRTALVWLLGSASWSIPQVRSASSMHQLINHQRSPSFDPSSPTLSLLENNENSFGLSRSPRSLIHGHNMHDDVEFSIARTRMRMDEPVFARSEVSDIRHSLESNIQRTLASRLGRASQEFSDFQIEKLSSDDEVEQ